MDIILLSAAFCAYLIKGIAGFANTLVFNSILSFRLASKTISPMDLILGFPSNIYFTWKERKSISIKVVITLSLLVLAGLIPGTFFLKIGNQQQLKIILGITVVILGIEMLLRLQNPNKIKPNAIFLSSVGILSGFLCGLFGIGAFLAAYISRTTENQNQFRGTICCVFLVENIFRIALYSITRILTIDILKSTVVMFPAMIIGLFAGITISKRMKERTVKIVVSILLMITGISLVLKNI